MKNNPIKIFYTFGSDNPAEARAIKEMFREQKGCDCPTINFSNPEMIYYLNHANDVVRLYLDNPLAQLLITSQPAQTPSLYNKSQSQLTTEELDFLTTRKKDIEKIVFKLDVGQDIINGCREHTTTLNCQCTDVYYGTNMSFFDGDDKHILKNALSEIRNKYMLEYRAICNKLNVIDTDIVLPNFNEPKILRR